jgi:hypothetical protein
MSSKLRRFSEKEMPKRPRHIGNCSLGDFVLYVSNALSILQVIGCKLLVGFDLMAVMKFGESFIYL